MVDMRFSPKPNKEATIALESSPESSSELMTVLLSGAEWLEQFLEGQMGNDLVIILFFSHSLAILFSRMNRLSNFSRGHHGV